MNKATLLRQIDDASALAREAFAAGDKVNGIAAIKLASDLLVLARIWRDDVEDKA